MSLDPLDPFETADVRAAVLRGWAASSARFREDANAEEDAATGGYRDRLVVELAQNAVDAATAAGVAARLLLCLDGDLLTASNTGAPLSTAGVLGLSTLRASAKRGQPGEVGRFGVGFAAVLAVSEAPSIGSRDAPAVRWSARDTAELLAADTRLAGEVALRDGHVPVLRLPFPAAAVAVPADYDTAVVLPLRPGSRVLVESLLATIDPTLPLALPGLTELRVEIDGRLALSLACDWRPDGPVLDGRRWVEVSRSGPLDPGLLADRPSEERGVPGWTVRALAPADGGGLPVGTPAVLRAPTVTDEPFGLPALVLASLPLEPTRRRVVRGRLADLILAEAGRTLAELAVLLEDPLPLVPVGLAAGDLEAQVRETLAAALPSMPVLGGRRGEESVVLDLGPASAAVAALLSDRVDGVLPVSYDVAGKAPALALLGVRRLDTAAVVELFAASDRTPAEWHDVYAALSGAPDRDALASLPVPLGDGRLVTGARGALLPGPDLPDEAALLPVRLVHPAAAHPLLAELGAQPASAVSLLADPATREAIAASYDDYDPDLARAIAGLVRAAGTDTRTQPWLATLALPAADGGVEMAGDLLLPGGLMDRAGADFPRLERPDWLDADVAVALGVLDGPALLVADNVALDATSYPEPDGLDDEPGLGDLPDVESWLADCEERIAAADGGRPELAEVVALRDLDTVDDLLALLAGIASAPTLRRAVIDPVRAGAILLPSYTGWWLSRAPLFDGLAAGEFALPGEPLLDGLYRPAPGGFDPELLAAVGVRAALGSLLEDPAATGDLLDRLGDAERTVGRAQARALYVAIAQAWGHRLDQAPDPPLAVRAVRPDGVLSAVATAGAVVADSPDLLVWAWARGLAVMAVPAARGAALAALLDVARCADLAGAPVEAGVERTVPDVFGVVPGLPSRFIHHDELAVDGVALPWRLHRGVLHATDAGLPAGLAWAGGQWGSRHLLADLVGDPDGLALRLLEADLDG